MCSAVTVSITIRITLGLPVGGAPLAPAAVMGVGVSARAKPPRSSAPARAPANDRPAEAAGRESAHRFHSAAAVTTASASAINNPIETLGEPPEASLTYDPSASRLVTQAFPNIRSRRPHAPAPALTTESRIKTPNTEPFGQSMKWRVK